MEFIGRLAVGHITPMEFSQDYIKRGEGQKYCASSLMRP